MPSIEEYLKSVMPTKGEVEAFTERRGGAGWLSKNGGFNYDETLGWVQMPAIRQDGVFKSKTFLDYEQDGARRLVNHGDKPSRIHTYGDSFTHCDQVSDGETWQEYLAAHFQEPIRNYGVGGYSVYQAYLRMKQVDAARSAEYIILNIYDHDHYRNLVDWWAVSFGRRVECGYTCPRLKINVAANTVEEIPNLLGNIGDVKKFYDPDWVIENFRDSPILLPTMAKLFPEWATWETAGKTAETFGLSLDDVKNREPLDAIEALFTEAALYSTTRVIGMTEEFIRSKGKKLMVILTHSGGKMHSALEGNPRWDQTFLDFLKTRDYPVVDTRDTQLAACTAAKADPESYLQPFYNGHHTPLGNASVAWGIREAVVNWLEPRPLPYAGEVKPILVHHDGWKASD